MPHRVNINQYGHAHELTFSCYHRYPFLQAEQTCHWLADSIASARKSEGFLLWSYVFMPDHVHLLVFPQGAGSDISRIRKAIKAPVAKKAIGYLREYAPDWLTKISRKRGSKVEHLFWQSGGGYDRNVIQSDTLLQMMDYIHNNPVRRSLVNQAKDWKWSSAAWYVDGSEIPLSVDPIPWEWLH